MPLSPILRPVQPELRTPRLRLRNVREGDGALVHQAVLDSLPNLRAWPASLPWALPEPSVDAAEKFCREAAAAFITRTSFAYLGFTESGVLVASIGLHHVDWSVPKFEVGFWCRAQHQGQGYVTEAAAVLCHHSFGELGAKRIEARADEQNAGSRRVCEKIGMQLEGTMRHERMAPDGSLRNTCLYAAVRQ